MQCQGISWREKEQRGQKREELREVRSHWRSDGKECLPGCNGEACESSLYQVNRKSPSSNLWVTPEDAWPG